MRSCGMLDPFATASATADSASRRDEGSSGPQVQPDGHVSRARSASKEP